MSDNLRSSRSRWLGRVAVLVVLAIVGWLAMQIYPLSRYGYTAQRINAKLHRLDAQRPADFSPRLWEESVGWSGVAFCNVCFSEQKTPYKEMLRLEQDLDARLREPVDLPFFEWWWNRIAETGPYGRWYVTRFKPQWDELVREETSQ